MAFLPTDLANLVMWVRPGSLALNDGDPIATWSDESGAGNHLTQATESKKPTYRTNVLNGHAAVRHVASSSQTLTSAGPSLAAPANYTVFTVAKFNTGTAGRIFAAAFGNWLLGWYVDGVDQAYFEEWVKQGGPAPDTTPRIYVGQRKHSTSNCKFWSGTTLLAENTNGLGGPNGFSSSGHNGASEFADCDAFELVAYNRILTDSELRQVITYLSGEYFGFAGVPRSIFHNKLRRRGGLR